MPMFWLGVAGGSDVGLSHHHTLAGRRRLRRGGAVFAAAAALLFGMAPSRPAALAQILGGIGWGLALSRPSLFAERYLPAPDSAVMLGGLFAMLALATVARIRSTPPASLSLCRCLRRSGCARWAAWRCPCCARASAEALQVG